MWTKPDNCEECGKPLIGLAATGLCDEHHAEAMRRFMVYRAIYEAVLTVTRDMGPDKIKQMSWFGKNHGR